MSTRIRVACLTVVFCLLACAQWSRAEEPFRYPEGRHGKGELRYIEGVPVLIVRGTHAEMGEQIGHLALKPASKMFELIDGFVDRRIPKGVRPLVEGAARTVYGRFPKEYREELEAMAAAGEVDKKSLIMANTVIDLIQMIGCASLLVGEQRSTAGGPLYGRNLDVYCIKGLAQYSLLVVQHPDEGHAFAMPNFPGFLMMASGINSKGLAMGTQSVGAPKDGSGKFNPSGVASAVAGRRLIERCADVDEARAWLEKNRLVRCVGIAACDPKQQAVLEVTTKRVLSRGPTDGLCCATNHFRHPELMREVSCRRYAILEKSRKLDRLSVKDVAELMKAATQGKATIHTMVFEPAKRRIHISMGAVPATDHPLATIDLAKLFAPPSPAAKKAKEPVPENGKTGEGEKPAETSLKWERISAEKAKLPPMTRADLLREYDKTAEAGKRLRSWEARCRVSTEMEMFENSPVASFLSKKPPKRVKKTHSILLRSCGPKWFAEQRDGDWGDEDVDHCTYHGEDSVQAVWPRQRSISILTPDEFAASVAEGSPRPELPAGFPPFLEQTREHHYPIPQALPDVRKVLAGPKTKAADWRARVDGRTCYVVEQTVVTETPIVRSVEEAEAWRRDNPDSRTAPIIYPKAKPEDKQIEKATTRVALDPEAGFMPARWTAFREIEIACIDRSMTNGEEIVCSDFRKFDGGGFVAGRFEYTRYRGDKTGELRAPARQEVVLEEFKVNQEYPADVFRVEFPKGYRIVDCSRGIAYRAGDSEAELSVLLRGVAAKKKFFEEFKKKPAPSLKAERWLNSEPIRLEDVRGKDVRLIFWSMGCGPCRYDVQRFQEAWERSRRHSNDATVLISIHPYMDEEGIEELEDFLRKNKIAFPVMVDSRKPDNRAWGKTCADYRVYGVPCEVRINAKGHVVQHGGERVYVNKKSWWVRNLPRADAEAKIGGRPESPGEENKE